MRICFVNLTFYPHIGGVERYIFEIGRELAKAEHEIMVVTSSYNSSHKLVPNHEVIDGVSVFRVPKDKLFLLRILIQLIKIQLKIGIDVIHTNCGITTLCSLPLKILFGIRLINTCHGAWMVCLNGGFLHFNGRSCLGFNPKRCSLCMHKSAFELRIERFVLMEAAKKVDTYIAVSGKVKRYVKYALPHRDIYVIHNGVDIDKFNKLNINESKQVRRKFGLTENDKIVLFVGRHIFEKGIEYLIRALPKVRELVPDLKAIVVGDGPDRQNLEKLSRRLNLDDIVIFPGFLSEDDLILAYLISDVLVLPTLGGLVEAFGIVLIEAMAMETPVVATNVGGISEVVKNGVTGILVEPKNSDQIAEALIRLLSDVDMMLKMGSAGRQRVEENFVWKNAVSRILSLYEEA